MAPTSISPDPRELEPIEDALRQANVGLHILDAGISRLADIAFRNDGLVEARLAHLVRYRGVDETVRILNDKHGVIRRLYVGPLARRMFSSAKARDAIADLVPLLEQRAELTAKIADLNLARRTLFERTDQERIRGLAPERPRGRPHKRPRSDF